MRSSLPLAYLDITPELLTEVCKSFRRGDGLFNLQVVKNGLPPDTKCLMIEAKSGNIVRLSLLSQEFKDGEVLLSPVIERVCTTKDSHAGDHRGH